MNSVHVNCWRCGSKFMRKHGACPECEAVIDESKDHWAYVQELERKVKAEQEACAQAAELCHDFGPSTRCPDCGNSSHVLHVYNMGRQDAAKSIRRRGK